MGRLVEIDAGELRFSPEETARLITSHADAPVDPSWPDFVYQHMLGWPAGTALAAGLAVRRDGGEGYGGHPAVLRLMRNLRNYFAEELFEGLPPALLQLCTELSILPVMEREIAQAITGRSDIGRLLEEAADRGLFLCRAAGRARTGYRFHPLFRGVLHDLLHEGDAGCAAVLHRRAAEYQLAHGAPDKALSHAEAGGDPAFLATILEQLAEALTYRGDLERVVSLAARIDWSSLARAPNILLCLAWYQIRALSFGEAERLLEAAEAAIRQLRDAPQPDERRIAELGRLLRHRRTMLLAARDDMPATEQASAELLLEFGDDNSWISCTLLAQLIAARRELFQLSDALGIEAATRRALRRPDSCFAVIALKAAAAPTLALQGRTMVAREMLVDALQRAESHTEAGAALVALSLAELCYDLGHLERARMLVDRYLPVARKWHYMEQLCAGHRVDAHILAAEGNRNLAITALDDAQLVALECGLPRMRTLAATAQIRLLLQAGRAEAAEDVAATIGLAVDVEPVPTLQPTRCQEAVAVAWIRLRMRDMQLSGAERVARRWRDLARRVQSVRSMVQFDLLLAEIAMLGGGGEAARRHIRAAVRGAADAGWIQLFLDSGTVITSLLRDAYGDGQVIDTMADRFAARLLAAIGATTPAVPGGLEDCLTAREVEILSLVGGGLRIQEIGRRLGLTEGTVKWYMQQIYDKLGVRRRPQAVRKAQTLGLLG